MAMAKTTPANSVVLAMVSSLKPTQRAVEMKAYHQGPFADMKLRKMEWKRGWASYARMVGRPWEHTRHALAQELRWDECWNLKVSWLTSCVKLMSCA